MAKWFQKGTLRFARTAAQNVGLSFSWRLVLVVKAAHAVKAETEEPVVLMTEAQLKAVEAALAKGDRVELIPVKDGVKVIQVKRKEIK